MKSRIRHIAIIVPDAEEAAQFYEKAFGFTRAGRARRGIYMTDGVINVALLTKEHENEKLGLYHFGVWVDDLDDAEKHVVDAGGSYLAGRPDLAQLVLRGEVPRPQRRGVRPHP